MKKPGLLKRNILVNLALAIGISHGNAIKETPLAGITHTVSTGYSGTCSEALLQPLALFLGRISHVKCEICGQGA